MKSVIAVVISLLIPTVPVLAQNSDPMSQAVTTDAKASKSADAMARNLQATGDPGSVPTTSAVPGTQPAPPTPQPQADPTQPQTHSDLKNDAPPAAKPEKKPSMFANMKEKLSGFVFKHPVITGALIGAMLGAFGGPAGMVIGAGLGAVVADVARFYLKKKK